jgi:hypothetical protein
MQPSSHPSVRMPGEVFPAACRGFVWAVLACTSGLAGDAGPTLQWEPREKYEAYIRETEARIQREVHSPTYLWTVQLPVRWERVRRGEVVVETWNSKGDLHIGEAIIHDWIGALFISGVKLDQVVSFLQDYTVHKNYYRPEVIESRLVSRGGNESTIYYRLVKKKLLTIVLNTDQAASYYPLSKTRWHTRSHATRIAEVKDAGKPTERELPPGKDHGFLWRLNTYWRLEEKDGGVYVECQTISLTREVPLGLRWLIDPIIRSLPGESLAHLLASTRAAVQSRVR